MTEVCAICGETERSPRHPDRNDTVHPFVPRPVSPEAAPPRATTERLVCAYSCGSDTRGCKLPECRPVSPEAATTPEPFAGPFMERRRAELWETMPAAFPTCSRDVLERAIEAQVHFDLGVAITERRASLAAAPSEEIGGMLDALTTAAYRLGFADATPRLKGQRKAYAIGETTERRALDKHLAALASDAREAERLRAALQEIAAWADREAHADSVHGDENSFACAIGDLARASLRATPPETTTQETTESASLHDRAVAPMPKIAKDAPAVGEPLTCPHGTWRRPHVIRCIACFPEPEP